MRTLTPSITNALAATTRTPALSVQLFDPLQHYALYQTLAISEGFSAATVAADGSIVRCYTDTPTGAFVASLFVQRITDPGTSSQWSAWLVLSSANLMRDAGCAISNNGGTLRIFAQSGSSPFNLLVWTSTDNGATWTGPTPIAAINAAIRGIGSAGNNDVFFAFDSGGGEALTASFWNGSAWSAPATWTLGVIPACVGMDAAWDSANSRYLLPVSDGEQISGYSYTPSGGAWNLLATIAPLDSASAVGLKRLYPRLQAFDGLWNLAYLEVDNGAFTGLVYSYARLRQSKDFLHWSDGLVLGQTFAYGPTWLKAPTPPIGSAGPAYYVMNNAFVWRANVYSSANPNQFQDVSSQVLEIQRHETQGKEGKLLLHLANTGGQYNALSMLGLNTSIALAEGYHDPNTGAPSTITTGIYYVDTISFLRAPGENELLILASDATKRLGATSGEIGPHALRGLEAYDVVHTRKAARKHPLVPTVTTRWKSFTTRYQRSYSNQPLSFLLTELAAIAGLFNVTIPGTTQFSETIPTFVIPSGHTLRAALDELCRIYSVVSFLDQTETLQFRELSPADAPVWTYQPEIETLTLGTQDQRANHVIVTGRSSTGALVFGESYDFPSLTQTGQERSLYHTDTRLSTAAQAALKAGLLLADEQRAGSKHSITVPAHPGLQLLDVITLVDSAAPTGTGQSTNARIVALNVRYTPQQALYDMTLTLEQP